MDDKGPGKCVPDQLAAPLFIFDLTESLSCTDSRYRHDLRGKFETRERIRWLALYSWKHQWQKWHIVRLRISIPFIEKWQSFSHPQFADPEGNASCKYPGMDQSDRKLNGAC